MHRRKKTVVQRSPGQVSDAFGYRVSPAVENMRSDWACVAGMARTWRETRATYRNPMTLLRHKSSGLMYTAFTTPLGSAFSSSIIEDARSVLDLPSASRASRCRASYRDRGHSPVWSAGHNAADGVSALSVGMIWCARADTVGTVERYWLFHRVCVCACGSPAACCSVPGHEGARIPQLMTLKKLYLV